MQEFPTPILIDIDKLKETMGLLLDKLKEREGKIIKLSKDYYWDIDEVELYNPYDSPTDFALGQLSFDWEHINNADSETFVPYDITKVSCLLKTLSTEYLISF